MGLIGFLVCASACGATEVELGGAAGGGGSAAASGSGGDRPGDPSDTTAGAGESGAGGSVQGGSGAVGEGDAGEAGQGGRGGKPGQGGAGESGQGGNYCYDHIIGSPGECVSISILEDEARRACEADGALFLDVRSPDGACDADSLVGTVRCCHIRTPAADGCFDQSLGKRGGCFSNLGLLERAHEVCAQSGAEVRETHWDEDCGPGSSDFINFECCSVDDTPPAPSQCVSDVAGSFKVCSPNEALLALAKAVCEERNLLLDVATNAPPEFDNDCGDKGSNFVQFDCCNRKTE
jgi:hypothetical protein